MPQAPKYYIVEANALPEIYLKVAEAKRLMETGEVATVNAATQRVGISRSAFYKYRDAIRPFQDMLHGRIVTLQIMLRDEPAAYPWCSIFWLRWAPIFLPSTRQFRAEEALPSLWEWRRPAWTGQ